MTSPEQPTRLFIDITAAQQAQLEEFQRKESLSSQQAAVQLLFEIGLESITSAGQRFWDRPFPVARDIYRSPNGDVWQLLKDPDSGRSMVRHVANAASGGSTREMTVAAFLETGNGPEHQALRTLMGDSLFARQDRFSA